MVCVSLAPSRREEPKMTLSTTILPASAAPAAIPHLAPTATSQAPHGAVEAMPRLLLRLEGAAALATAVASYAYLDGGWGRFAALCLLPDLSLLGYLAGPRVGAATYNLAHGYVGPALAAAASLALGTPALLLVALIWAAHIGFDRMLGYGLKYPTAFVDTHLGRIGAGRRAAAAAERGPST